MVMVMLKMISPISYVHEIFMCKRRDMLVILLIPTRFAFYSSFIT